MLETIRTAYLAAVAALVAKYPAQERCRAIYEGKAGAMRLGRLRRRVRTKLHDFPKGTVVALLPEDEHHERLRREEGREEPFASIWAPGISSGETWTLVDASDVEPVCATCEGAGRVHPHPSALLVLPCPAC